MLLRAPFLVLALIAAPLSSAQPAPATTANVALAGASGGAALGPRESACTPSNAVVLVHGYRDTGRIFGPMGRRLTASGFDVYAPTLAPSDGSAPLDTLAADLAAYVEATLPPGTCFGLVGYSMGGLVARAYAQSLPDARRVTALVTLATPHRGTLSAYARRGLGTRQMRPGSPFLRALDANVGRLANVPFTSLWTPFDLMIVPASSSRVPYAAGGPVLEAAHPMMYLSPRVARRVAGLLRPARAAGSPVAGPPAVGLPAVGSPAPRP